jgi:DNA-binding response OmpR family regulator
MSSVLEAEGFEVATRSNWSEVPGAVLQLTPDVLLVDLWMPDYDREALVRAREAAPGALMAVISSYPLDHARRVVADVAGIDLMFAKSERPDLIARALLECFPDRRPPA